MMKSHESTSTILANLSEEFSDEWLLFHEQKESLACADKIKKIKANREKEDLEIKAQENNPHLSNLEKEKLNTRKRLIKSSREFLDNRKAKSKPTAFTLLVEKQASLLREARTSILMASLESNALCCIAGRYDANVDDDTSELSGLLDLIKHKSQKRKITLSVLGEFIDEIFALLPPLTTQPMSMASNSAAISTIDKLLEAYCLGFQVCSDEDYDQNDEDCVMTCLLKFNLRVHHLQPQNADDATALAHCKKILKNALLYSVDGPKSAQKTEELIEAFCSLEAATQFLSRSIVVSDYSFLMFLVLLKEYPQLLPLGKRIQSTFNHDEIVEVLVEYKFYPDLMVSLIDTTKDFMQVSARQFLMSLIEKAETDEVELKLISVIELYKQNHPDQKAMAELGDPALWSALKTSEALAEYLSDEEHDFIPEDEELIRFAQLRFAADSLGAEQEEDERTFELDEDHGPFKRSKFK